MIDMQTVINEINAVHRLYAKTPVAALISSYQRVLGLLTDKHTGQISAQKSLAMLQRLIHLAPDKDAVMAAFFYPFYIEYDLSKEALANLTNKTVMKLLRDIERMQFIESVQEKTTSFSEKNQQSNNLRKMLLAMVDDARVVVIKLVERLVFMESLRSADNCMKKQAAHTIEKIYAPLANCLGVGQLKWQLEDFAFRYRDPDNYLKIAKALNMRREDREVYIELMRGKIRQLLQDANIRYMSIDGRAKHILSIYRKLHRKHVDLNEIYDTSALRILVSNIKTCYEVLGVIHSAWVPIAKEFDDYIANPKPNGYQSIHTAVIGPQNRYIEIQIRTVDMHQHSELGVAAHWVYKETQKSVAAGNTDENKINYLRQVILWQQEVDQAYPSVSIQSIFNDRVYVFTPNQDVIDLPKGATPIDLAYAIHTHIGHHCRGAKVNDTLVPLNYQLKTGDRAAILVSKSTTPSRDWLRAGAGYLMTANARAKVQHYFKHQYDEENFDLGTEIWNKFCRRHQINKNLLNDVVDAFAFNTKKQLLIALGNNDIHVRAVYGALRQKKLIQSAEHEKHTKPVKSPAKSNKKTPVSSSVVIDGVHDLVTQTARCCKPIPGDAILGYITQTRGISVHKKDCRNVERLKMTYPERLIDIEWDEQSTAHYPVGMLITAENDEKLLNEIIRIVSAEKIPLVNLSSQVSITKNQNRIRLTLNITGQRSLNTLVQKLKQLPRIIKVRRN
jgi:GTP pyrophosphokinase